MNEKESLEVIRDMIDRTKSNLRYQSPFYLIWGWLIFLAALLEYSLLTWMPEFTHHHVVWPVAILIGVASTIFLSARRTDSKRVTTYADRALLYFWSSWSFLLMLFLVYSVVMDLSWGSSYAFIIGLYGMGATVSGGILKFNTLVYAGIFSFILAAISLLLGFVAQFDTMLLFLALSIFVSYLIPGYKLRRS
jgi:hypothetical protein